MKQRLSTSIIKRLRAEFPGVWTWDGQANVWRHESGFHVYRSSQLAPSYPDDSSTFLSHLRRSDTGERVLFDICHTWTE